MQIALQPMDIIVFDGTAFNPLHKIVEWRCLENAVHCVTVMEPSYLSYSGTNKDPKIYDLDLSGFKISNISEYTGRGCTVHRYKKIYDQKALLAWCWDKYENSKGYDTWHQWFLGFTLGLTAKSLANDENRWTCAELPYWAFQENGYKLTNKEEMLPMPRLFRFHPDFDTIYSGIL